MGESSFRGAFPHQHHDPRDLRERIDSQLRQRLAEAVEMFALKHMVEQRARLGRPAPDTSSTADRREFEGCVDALYEHLRRAFDAELAADHRTALADAEQGAAAGRERALAAQVWLSRQLPDYWQRLERYAGAFVPDDSARGRPGWLARIFAGDPAERPDPGQGAGDQDARGRHRPPPGGQGDTGRPRGD